MYVCSKYVDDDGDVNNTIVPLFYCTFINIYIHMYLHIYKWMKGCNFLICTFCFYKNLVFNSSSSYFLLRFICTCSYVKFVFCICYYPCIVVKDHLQDSVVLCCTVYWVSECNKRGGGGSACAKIIFIYYFNRRSIKLKQKRQE